jgi:hypothetical protein
MTETAGLQFWEVHFDLSGKLLKHVGAIPPQVTDVFLFAHAWNNDYNDAKTLYDVFFGHLAEELVEHGAKPDIQIGLAGVFWPSMLWPGDEPSIATTGDPMFGPVERDWTEELKTAFATVEERAAIDRIRAMVDARPSDPNAVEEFRGMLRTLCPEGVYEFEDLAALAPADAPEQPGFPEALSDLWNGAQEKLSDSRYMPRWRAARRWSASRALLLFFPLSRMPCASICWVTASVLV